MFCFLFCGELKGKPGCGSEELLHPVGLNVGTRHFLQCLGEKSWIQIKIFASAIKDFKEIESKKNHLKLSECFNGCAATRR